MFQSPPLFGHRFCHKKTHAQTQTTHTRARPQGPVLLLHGANLFLCLAIAVVTVWVTEGSPVFGFAYLFTAVILWLKLISYAHCNRDLRLAWRERALAAKEKEKEKEKGPDGGAGEGEGGAWRGGGGTTGGWSVEGFSDAEGNGGEQQVSGEGGAEIRA